MGQKVQGDPRTSRGVGHHSPVHRSPARHSAAQQRPRPQAALRGARPVHRVLVPEPSGRHDTPDTTPQKEPPGQIQQVWCPLRRAGQKNTVYPAAFYAGRHDTRYRLAKTAQPKKDSAYRFGSSAYSSVRNALYACTACSRSSRAVISHGACMLSTDTPASSTYMPYLAAR